MAVYTWLNFQISKQYGQVFVWSVVCFAIGIGLYFSLRFEPDFLFLVALSLFGLFSFALVARFRYLIGVAAFLPVMMVLGCAWAGINARSLAAPILSYHYYGPIYGRVIHIDRSSSHALRLTLDQVQLTKMSEDQTPERIRISLHGRQEWLKPQPGQYIGLTGHLSGPDGPVEPGGFDFQRHAWFLQLGAVGYTRTPALEMKPPEGAMPIANLRFAISRFVADYLGGDVGGFAAAVTTGDRSAFSQEAINALRISNLAHLLAISGLHMGLLAAFLFGTIRLAFSLRPSISLRIPVKKIAAIAALIGATGYLLLSGASIATQRAFIMAAVALIAVTLDRRALTLRSVAIAAFIVLALRPSSLLSPGFQMSFAATTALVYVFSALRDIPGLSLRRWQKTIFTLVLSSAIAGLATAPFAAAHFNQWAAYGLLANVLAVPAMGMIVIPGAVLAALLSPFGGAGIGLDFMAIGLRWILLVANWVSALEGARVPVVTPNAWVLPVLGFSGCWLILWKGHLRWLAAFGMGVAIMFWVKTDRPMVLISGDGKLVGVLTDQGRALSKTRGQGFVAKNWLENDGDEAPQAEAAARGELIQPGVFVSQLAEHALLHYQGKKGVAQFTECTASEIVVLDQTAATLENCEVFDASRLASTGAVAIWIGGAGELSFQTVAERRGRRLWSPPNQLNQ
ncbi:ComEC/Rec2 family competence protein [Cognatishimia activa]|uniref:ComEC/Rec2 family competence protein n=1 Tax=Cognatishimia activa TaxID=1715691 RepID=UPI002230B976|nr:ComEC/Rec2 family competence protein [Cognatishimia activa]UZD92326.1 ComEC family competence protein [Cognatishimia activa]